MCSNEVGVGADSGRGSFFRRVSCRMKSSLMSSSGLALNSSCHQFACREDSAKRTSAQVAGSTARDSLALPKTQSPPRNGSAMATEKKAAAGRASLEIPASCAKFESSSESSRNLVSNGVRHTQSMNMRAMRTALHAPLEQCNSNSNSLSLSRVTSYNRLLDATGAAAALSASKSFASSACEVSIELDPLSQSPPTAGRNSAADGGGNAHAPLRLRKHFSIVGGKPGMGESARNKRVLKMLLIVVALFGLLWMPNYIYIVVVALGKLNELKENAPTSQLTPSNSSNSTLSSLSPSGALALTNSSGSGSGGESSMKQWLFELLRSLVLWLGAANAAINPWVYCLYSQRYRMAFRRLISCRALRERFLALDVGVRIGVVTGEESVSRISYVRRSHSYNANATRPAVSRRCSGNRPSQASVALLSEGGACGDGWRPERLKPNFASSKTSRTLSFGSALSGSAGRADRTTRTNDGNSRSQVLLSDTAQVHTDSDIEVPIATTESLNDQKPSSNKLDLPAIDEERHNSTGSGSGCDSSPGVGVSVAQLLSALASAPSAPNQIAGGAAPIEGKKELQVSFCPQLLLSDSKPLAANSNSSNSSAKRPLGKNNSIPKIQVGEPATAKLFKSLSLKRFTERRKQLHPSASEMVSLATVKEQPDNKQNKENTNQNRDSKKDNKKESKKDVVQNAKPTSICIPEPATEAKDGQQPKKSKSSTRYNARARKPRFLFALLLSSHRRRTTKSLSQPSLQMVPPTPPAASASAERRQSQQTQQQMQKLLPAGTPSSDSQHSPSTPQSLPTPQSATPVTAPRRISAQVPQATATTVMVASPRLGRPSSVCWLDGGGGQYCRLSPLACVATASNSALDAGTGADASLPHVNSFSGGGAVGGYDVRAYRQSYARQKSGSRCCNTRAEEASSCASTGTTTFGSMSTSSPSGKRATATGSGATCVNFNSSPGSAHVAGVRELITVQANFVFPSPHPSPRFSLHSPADVNSSQQAIRQGLGVGQGIGNGQGIEIGQGLGTGSGQGPQPAQVLTPARAHRYSQPDGHEHLTRPATAPTLLGFSVLATGAGALVDR